jgi:hypothetical protein
MSESRAVLNEAIDLETEAAEGIGAARAEHELGQPALSLDLLKKAVEKERASLDLLDEGVDTLKQALDRRREALDQQTEILDQMMTTFGGNETI